MVGIGVLGNVACVVLVDVEGEAVLVAAAGAVGFAAGLVVAVVDAFGKSTFCACAFKASDAQTKMENVRKIFFIFGNPC